jgi:ribosomal protein L11 methyltransferase
MLKEKFFEYSFSTANDELLKIFESNHIQVVEEYFNNKTTYRVYSVKDIDKYFNDCNVLFEKKDVNKVNWLDEWKNFLKPGLLCEKIAYKNDMNVEFNKLDTIYINPSLAFGTGSHPTTFIAASLMEDICKNRIVFDVGTGSAILSILAEKLGAIKVYACDIDKNSVNNINDNIRNNNCRKIDVYIGSIDKNYDKIKCDIIVANILYDALIYLWQYMLAILPEYIVLSGFYRLDHIDFLSNITLNNYKIDRLFCKDNWWGIRFCRLL